MALSRKGIFILSLVLLAVGFVIGFLLSYAAVQYSSSSKAEKLEKLTAEADNKLSSTLLNSVNSANIRKYLKELTSKPHLSGSPQSKVVAEKLISFWHELGLETHLSKYNVLLSYPDPDNPNRIELQDGSGNPIYTTQLFEKILRPEQNHSDVVPPFNAYAAPGTPQGDLVYVNYGRLEDFQFLNDEKLLNLSNKLCIARYGKIFRGEKAKFAKQFGAKGLILYSDPQDYNVGNQEPYPNSWWLPGTGVQRGSLKIMGDPLTPGYPAIDSAYRIPESDVGLPTIPVHPIGYDDAYRLLEGLGGEAAPEEWQGGLNFTYRIGPGYTDPNRKVQMFVSTSNQNVDVYNAFGIIKGSVEPDRYVLLGNHHDAWVFGAVDPSSGTAAIMELSRVFAAMVKKGWKPRRTIIFCSWAAEEQSLVGSKEFVEEYRHILSSRAVAYLNVDMALDGNAYFRGRSLPLLFDAILDVAKNIPNPDKKEIASGRRTVFDTWKHMSPERNEEGQLTGLPKIPILGSGSDFEPFIQMIGVACVDMRYHFDDKLGISSYPLYHSVYETFHLVDEIMDPGFRFHKAVTQFWGELARRLSDSLILPMKVTDYSKSIRQYIAKLLSMYEDQMMARGLTQEIEYLSHAVNKLHTEAEKFQRRLHTVDKTNPIAVRMYNDQMSQLERVFIDHLGLPGRKFYRHVVFAPSSKNTYAGTSFPGLGDALFEIHKYSGQDEISRWEDVKKQLSVVTYFIEASANYLKNYGQF